MTADAPETTPPVPFNLFPTRHRSFLQLIIDHNPCFMLSTVCMLLGCFLLSSAMDVQAGDLAKLFCLLGAINLYEFSIIFLGILLVRRHQTIARDGLWLLLFQALLLADPTFLIAETLKTSPHWGFAVNIALLALAILKATLVLRALRIPLSLRTLGFLILQLLLIYGIPIWLNNIADNGIIGPTPMYVLWWLVGLLPILYELLTHLCPLNPPQSLLQHIIRRSYLIVPYLLLIAHLGFFHYTYHADFKFADLAPLLLGLSFCTLRIRVPEFNLAFLRFLLPAAAIAFTLYDGATLHYLRFTISPLLSIGYAALLAYAYFVYHPMAFYTALASFIAAACYAFQFRLYALLHFLISLFPTTPTGWGILSLLLAFALLPLGAYFTLRKPHPHFKIDQT